MVHEQVRGELMKRYTNKYLNKRMNPKDAEIKERVDCWVFVEDFESTLIKCLQKFEAQGGTVNWEAPILKPFLAHANTPHAAAVKVGGNNDHHGNCEQYFDAKLARMVEKGPEATIYRKFGYSSCCSKNLAAASRIVHPWKKYILSID